MARSLPADLAFLLSVTEELGRARIEIDQTTARGRRRNGERQMSKSVVAQLMADNVAIPLAGVGKTATEAVHELRGAVEREASRLERKKVANRAR